MYVNFVAKQYKAIICWIHWIMYHPEEKDYVYLLQCIDVKEHTKLASREVANQLATIGS